MTVSRRNFIEASIGALLTAPFARAGATCRRRPYVQNIRRTRATVRWTTYEEGQASVAVRAGGAERIVPAKSVYFPADDTGLHFSYYRHEAVITELAPGADYSYVVRLDGDDVVPDTGLGFRTTGVTPFTFLAVGDTGTGSAEQRRLAQLMEAEGPGLLVHTGDLVYPTGQLELYERLYFDFYHATMSRVPFFPCPGNHDYYETLARPYVSIHDLPVEDVPASDHGRYYSFDWGDLHFISLDSNESLVQAASGRGQMLRWLERDLAATKKFWRVAYFHHPPFAFGPNIRDREAVLARSHVVPILERYGVPLVFNGHEHSYQRTREINGVVYVTTGGGGAGLYRVDPSDLLAAGKSAHHYMRGEVNGRRLALRAIGLDGQEFDHVVLNPPPVLSRQGVLNAASFTTEIGSGAIVSVFGWQMGVETLDNGGRPLDKTSGVRVLLGDQELPLLMVSPTQVNAVLPGNITGRATLQVITPGGSASSDLEILPVAPALFPAVTDRRDSLVTPDSPCAPGSEVSLFSTGLAGFGGSVRALVSTEAVAARLSSTFASGLQRITLELPSSLESGTHLVSVEAEGVRSNAVPVAIRAFS
ncbi:MAG: metallophosphoesterase [Bryobacteraceae bacterium]